MQSTPPSRRIRRPRGWGFTLVELLVSLGIIISLVSMATAIYSSYARDTNVQVLKANLFMLRTAIQRFYQDHGRYPIHGKDIHDNRISFLDNGSSELVQGIYAGPDGAYPPIRRGYIQEIPVDPSTNLPDWDLLTLPESFLRADGSSMETRVVTNVLSRNPVFRRL